MGALGQSFFTLSLGMGAMLTYGSYLNKKEKINDNAVWIIGLDTGIAVIAGFAILPAVFALGFDPGAGGGLAFITLPGVFATMPGGTFFDFLDFLQESIILPLGALLTTIFAGYVWKAKRLREAANSHVGAIKLGKWFDILVRFVVPVGILIVMIFSLIDKFN